MIDVWLIGHTFDGWENWKEQVQFNLLAKAFLSLGCDVKFITLDKLKIYDNSRLVVYDNEVFEPPNIAIIKTYIHTNFWKNKLSRLQEIGSLVINDPIKAVDYDNKINIYQKAQINNIPMPKTIFMPYSHCDDLKLNEIENTIGWPCIIKPNLGWGGIGLNIVNSRNDMRNSIISSHKHYNENFKGYGLKPTHFIAQEIVKAEGMISAINVGKNVYASIYHGSGTHLTKTYYKNNFLSDSYNKKFVVVPIDPPDNLIELISKIRNLYDLKLFKAEFFITQSGFSFCEINTTAGFILNSLISRINIADDIAKYAVNLWQSTQ